MLLSQLCKCRHFRREWPPDLQNIFKSNDALFWSSPHWLFSVWLVSDQRQWLGAGMPWMPCAHSQQLLLMAVLYKQENAALGVTGPNVMTASIKHAQLGGKTITRQEYTDSRERFEQTSTSILCLFWRLMWNYDMSQDNDNVVNSSEQLNKTNRALTVVMHFTVNFFFLEKPEPFTTCLQMCCLLDV